MPHSPHIDPRASLRDQLIYTLRTLRTLKGLTQEQLAKELFLSREAITAYENGRNFPDLDTCKQFDAHFGTDELFQSQWTHAQREHVHEWFETYLAHENEAIQINSFQSMYIPGLLQTEEYTRAISLERGTDEAVIDQRAARREVITRENNPAYFFAVLDHAVISRPVGGGEVMMKQLQHLITMSRKLNVFVQVVPERTGWYLGMDGTLVVFVKEDGRPVGYVEAQFGGRLIEDREAAGKVGLRFDQIRGRALSVDASRDLIQRTMEAMHDDPVAEE
jgi:transcriptional regulator with XRE-family HTH domain